MTDTNDSSKKISFGFSKIQKKPSLLIKPAEVAIVERKPELIECLEGKAIKIKDAVEEEFKKPLIIPLKDDQKNLLDRIRISRKQAEKTLTQNDKNPSIEDTRPDSVLTIDELAAREVLREAQNRLSNNTKENSKVSDLVLPIHNEVLEGEKAPSLEDYESVPISDFGIAMLRGMGWKEGMGIGKNNANIALIKAPEQRPKGLGLGAEKLIIDTQNNTEKRDDLQIVKRGYAKIVAGSKRGNYCQIVGFDDEERVDVKLALTNEIVNINGAMLQAITKDEYSKGSRVLNNAKYEQHKDTESSLVKTERDSNERSTHSSRRNDESSSSSSRHRKKSKKHRSRRRRSTSESSRSSSDTDDEKSHRRRDYKDDKRRKHDKHSKRKHYYK